MEFFPENIILLIEDSNEDFYTTKRTFEKLGVEGQLFRCIDGADALDFLYHRGKYADKEKSPLPNLILLDLNLPKKDGREVLKEIKNDPSLNFIPVIILTTSTHDKDIEYCYKMGANSYMQKPVDLNKFFDAMKRLKDYWLEIVILPKKQP